MPRYYTILMASIALPPLNARFPHVKAAAVQPCCSHLTTPINLSRLVGRPSRFLIAIAIASGLFACQARADDLDMARAALQQHDYPTAFKLFKPLAEAGDPAAQNNLGILYRNGMGVPADNTESLKWFQRSAEQGNAFAEYNLGLAYEMGWGTPKDHREALKWYMLSAQQGDTAAQKALQKFGQQNSKKSSRNR